MARSEYLANEGLASTPAHRVARVHYEVTRRPGPMEITAKALAFVFVIGCIVALLAGGF